MALFTNWLSVARFLFTALPAVGFCLCCDFIVNQIAINQMGAPRAATAAAALPFRLPLLLLALSHSFAVSHFSDCTPNEISIHIYRHTYICRSLKCLCLSVIFFKCTHKHPHVDGCIYVCLYTYSKLLVF